MLWFYYIKFIQSASCDVKHELTAVSKNLTRKQRSKNNAHGAGRIHINTEGPVRQTERENTGLTIQSIHLNFINNK